MTDPTWNAMVQAHIDELRSEADHERLAAIAHPARRRCPLRAHGERRRDECGRRVLRIDEPARRSALAGDRA